MNSPAEFSAAARDFVKQWTGKGYEKGQTQPFWLHLLRVLGVEAPESAIEFEDAAHMDTAHGFLDAYIPSTHVLIEQKSLGKSLRDPIRQSDGFRLTPYQQARRYSASLPYSRRPRWIVTCNFAEWLVYDMENPNGEPESIRLADLERDLYRLRFLVNAQSGHIAREMEVSVEAGGIVGRIYDALLAQYGDTSPETLRWLNILCVRLVFCLYAEDASVFRDDQFHDYLVAFAPDQCRRALLDLFAVLDTPPEKRSRYLAPALAEFPYVNGGLFSEPIEIPQFTPELREAVLQEASLGFDWSDISPTIFGAVFESTLNPETRRSGGMHYTSVENIHKVIDPLFLDALRRELDAILADPVPKSRAPRLRAFQDRLASLSFLDPACGSGNFLTETYLSLRRLENDALAALIGPQSLLDLEGNPIKVKVQIAQFYGIEINDFAVSVAKTALWIAESQMLAQTATLLHRNFDFLPLKSYDGIAEGNALRVDWASLAPRPFDYIIGNPPFVGGKMMDASQKEDMHAIFGKKWKNLGNMDYVCCWYKKAFDLMRGTSTRAALVSTNSIVQGQAVASLLGPLMEDGLHIDFAHRTFRWDSESSLKAHVHCVIIGFSCHPRPQAALPLYDGPRPTLVPHINAYLLPAPDIVIDNRTRPLCDVPPMDFGSMPNDGGNFLLTEEERQEILAREPNLAAVIRPFVGAVEFLNGKTRFCFWLKNATPAFLRASPILHARLEAIRNLRLASTAAPTRAKADTPHLFFYDSQPESENYLLVPGVSSERRRYIPIGFMPATTVASNATLIVASASLYHFGILTSNVHMAWTRVVCGRLKSDYRYSGKVVYNNFPWPIPTDEQKARIEKTAKGILDARAAHPGCSLADLYDELTMPQDLRKAHRENDRAVLAAYGFPATITESDCVAELFKLYQTLSAHP